MGPSHTNIATSKHQSSLVNFEVRRQKCKRNELLKILKAQKAGSKDVLHIVDLKNVPVEAKADFKTKVLDKLGSSQGVEFLND